MKLSAFQPKRTDQRIDFNTFASIYNRMRKILNMKFDRNKFQVIDSDAGLFISLNPVTGTGTATVDETVLPFGVVAGTQGTVNVYNPCIQHSSFTILPSYSSVPTTVQVLGGTINAPQFVCARYARLATLEVVSPALTTIPTNSVEYFWFPICAVYLSSTGTTIVPYRFIRSMIIFPGEI